jgi:hypothetical protein
MATLLAIIGALGSLGLGALVGAVVAYRLRERADVKREESELRGLLRLIAFEVSHNDQVMIDLHREKKETSRVKELADNLRTDAWEDTRVRIAQLLPAEEFNNVCAYYIRVSRLIYATRKHPPQSNLSPLLLRAISIDTRQDLRMLVGQVLMEYVEDFEIDWHLIGEEYTLLDHPL